MAPEGASARSAPGAAVAPASSLDSLEHSPLPPPPSQPVDVPPTDKRLYRAISLPNGMQALMIHDPDMAAEVKGAGEKREKEKTEGKGDDDNDEGSSDESGDDSDTGSDDSASRGSSLADGAITDSESDSEDGIGKKKKKGGKRHGKNEIDDDGDEDEDEGEEEEEEEEEASKVKKAAAAVAVGVGSLCDPLRMQGLAHYLEHMLFMGSEKYPDENE